MNGSSAVLTILRDTLRSSALASLTATALAVGLARRHGQRAPAVPNAVAHMAEGRRAAGRQDWSRHSAEGIALNFFGCLAWTCVAEGWAALRPYRDTGDALGRGATLAALAYVVDQHVLPRRWQPVYDVVLPLPARLAVYATLALTLPLCSFLRHSRARRPWQAPSARLISGRLITAGRHRHDAGVDRR